MVPRRYGADLKASQIPDHCARAMCYLRGDSALPHGRWRRDQDRRGLSTLEWTSIEKVGAMNLGLGRSVY